VRSCNGSHNTTIPCLELRDVFDKSATQRTILPRLDPGPGDREISPCYLRVSQPPIRYYLQSCYVVPWSPHHLDCKPFSLHSSRFSEYSRILICWLANCNLIMEFRCAFVLTHLVSQGFFLLSLQNRAITRLSRLPVLCK